MMKIIASAALALGFALVPMSSPVMAQGVHVGVGPMGVHVGSGHHGRMHRHRHERCRTVITRVHRHGTIITRRERRCD
jgi:hypothetical protein